MYEDLQSILICFVSKQSKTSNAVEMSSLKFAITNKGASQLSVCSNSFPNFVGSLNKRWMYPAQTITSE